MSRLLKASIAIAVVAVAFLAGRELTREFLGDDLSEAELAAGLAAAAREINAQVPVELDEMTTLVSANASGADLTYTNRISVDAVEVDANFEELQRDVLKELVCGNEDMMVTINHGGSFTYEYIDPNGKPVASIGISKPDCAG